jgi:hypothetical protein
MRPVIVLSPPEELASGLVAGFFCRKLLRDEFAGGVTLARALLSGLSSFECGNDGALDDFLLEHITLPSIAEQPPRPGLWALWANASWRRQD